MPFLDWVTAVLTVLFGASGIGGTYWLWKVILSYRLKNRTTIARIASEEQERLAKEKAEEREEFRKEREYLNDQWRERHEALKKDFQEYRDTTRELIKEKDAAFRKLEAKNRSIMEDFQTYREQAIRDDDEISRLRRENERLSNLLAVKVESERGHDPS